MNPTGGKKSWPERVIEGRKSREEKLKKGWEDTPDGLLSIKDVRDAGYIKNSEGHWCIPAEEYIYAAEDGYKQPGQKYWAASQKYLRWREARKQKLKQNKFEIKSPSMLQFIEDVQKPIKYNEQNNE